MAAYFPPTGRLARLPSWDGAKLSSLRDFLNRFAKGLAPGMIFSFSSAAQALQVMKTDGAPVSDVFVVSGDPAVYRLVAGATVRIGPGIVAWPVKVKFEWAAGNKWSSVVSVPIDLDGRTPDWYSTGSLSDPAAFNDISPRVAYIGGAENPDWNAGRAKVMASSDPAPTVAMTRYSFLTFYAFGE